MDGEEIPVVELNLHQYVNMSKLKCGLTEEEYDKVRYLLGLDPLREASVAGQEITERIRDTLGAED